jgi:methionyl-tRNA synthetase
MLKAQQQGVTPEQLIAEVEAEHRSTLGDFLIGLDNFHTTHSAENVEYTTRIFTALDRAGFITRRTIRQAYDAQVGMFLPDRYVKGTCPRCKTPDQYGDSCESCGATYSPSDLIDPVSVVSGTAPVERESEHLFFSLGAFEEMLREWTRSGSLQAGVTNKLDEWFAQGLRDWDISRDAPYFGIEIPGAPGKYFYVWLDAPIGYMASFRNLCDRAGLDFDAYWSPDSEAELYHFIGKDIVYFHTLFWPATLHGSGFRKPTAVFAHGFLTINGQKMSKSRGTFITGRRYLDHLPPEYLRYFFAAKLGPGLEDLDLNLEEFTLRVNSEIVGKLVNIASRCAGFITRGHAGRLSPGLPDHALYDEFVATGRLIGALYEARDYSAAIREIMALADRANLYIDQNKPWLAAKDPARAGEVQAVCTQGLNLFRVLIGYLKPVLPDMAARAEAFLGAPLAHWSQLAEPLLGTEILPYEPLATRLDAAHVQKIVDAPAEPAAAPVAAVKPAAAQPAKAASQEPAAEVTVDDFRRLDLRIARVLSAELVEGADKLLRLSVDLGSEQRTIFAGIREAYEPSKLIGRLVVVVANLKPRKMRFGVSQGMVLAAGPGGADIFVVSPDDGAAPGMQVT